MNLDQQTQELQEARQRLEDVLSAAGLGFWTWDIQKDHLVGDENIAFLFGIDPDVAAEGAPAEIFIQRVEPDDQPAMRSELARVLAAGGKYELEYRVRGSDNKLRWVASRGQAQLDEANHAKSLNGIVQDITERKNSERQLIDSEERLRLATEAAEIALWIWYFKEDRLTWENGRLHKILNLSPEEEPINAARFLKDVIHPDDAEMFKRAVAATLETGSRFHFVGRLRRHPGGFGWIEFTGQLKHSMDGSPERIVGTAADITEAKQAVLQLEEQARLSALGAEVGRALTQGVTLRESLQVCAEAMAVHLDAAFARIWTLSEKEAVLELQASAGLYTHIDGGHSRIPVGSYKIGRIAQQRRPHLTNDVASDPDVSDPGWAKKEGMVAFAGYPLLIEGRLAGVLGLFARHPLKPEALNALASVSDSLAVAIERKRATDELVRQAEELRRSNRDLEQFAHVASHDLRSPLRTVMLYSQLLERKLGEQIGDGKKLLDTVNSAAKRMSTLIEDLLLYASVSKPGETSGLALVDANIEIAIAIESLSAEIEESRASVTYDPLPSVPVDKACLTQLFQNLIGNAIHYRSESAPIIHVCAGDESGRWLVSCKDNGMGIGPQFRDEIFEAFHRLHGPELPGTGIGLAVCKKIVERYGGRIWVISEEGRGSTFFFTLPKNLS